MAKTGFIWTPQLRGEMSEAGRCGYCKQTLGSKAILGLGKLWHQDCFACEDCKAPIRQTFVERAGQALCRSCYALKFNVKCQGCGDTIYGPYVWAAAAAWHRTCWVCRRCGVPFPSARFYLVNGAAYDLDCHWAARLEQHNPS